MKFAFVFLCLFAGICSADELPDSPKPKPEIAQAAAPRFWDRTNKIEFTGMVLLAGWDMGQTCDSLSHGGREYWLTQSCPKDVAITAGIDAAALGLAWLLHRTGHHRLERLPMLWKAGDSLHGIIFSEMHGGT